MPRTIASRPPSRFPKRTFPISVVIFIASLGLISCGGSGGPSPHTSIGNPLRILSSNVISAAVGAPYQTTLAASGGTQPYWWTISDGYLPHGLVLDPNTGRIIGTPTQTGEFSFTAVVKDSAFIQQQQARASMTLSVLIPPLIIITPGVPFGSIGSPYHFQMQASGGIPPYTWSVISGTLAPGLQLNPLTGDISGIPQLEGTFSGIIQVADSNYPPSYATFRFGAPEGESLRGLSSQDQLFWGVPPDRNLSAERTRLFLTQPYIAR